MNVVEIRRGPLRADQGRVPGGWPDALSGLGEVRTFGRRDVILDQGAHAPDVHILLFGRALRQRIPTSAAAATIFDVHTRGDVIGLCPVLDGGPQADMVVAASAVTTLAIDQDTFADLLERDPRVRLCFDEAVARRIRRDANRATSLASDPVEIRYRRLLVDLAERFGVHGDCRGLNVDVGLTRRELAGLLGAALETVIRQTNALRGAGLIITDGRRFLIPDLEQLAPPER